MTDVQRTPLDLSIPMLDHSHVHLTFDAIPDEAGWTHLLTVLDAMKPGIVRPEEAAHEPLADLTDAELHARRAHPDWEYATTVGVRKAFDEENVPPAGRRLGPERREGRQRLGAVRVHRGVVLAAAEGRGRGGAGMTESSAHCPWCGTNRALTCGVFTDHLDQTGEDCFGSGDDPESAALNAGFCAASGGDVPGLAEAGE